MNKQTNKTKFKKLKLHAKSHAKVTNPPGFHNIKTSPQLGSQTNPSLKKMQLGR